MKTKILLLSGLAFCLNAFAADEVKSLPKGDVEFAQKAAMGGLLEVKLGELAEKRAANPGLKDFGKMMATDHGQANLKLQGIAKAQNIELPATLDNKHQDQFDALAKLEGKEFDKKYAAEMVEGHEKTLKLFKHEADDGKDGGLKAFAAETLPTIQTHLDKIRQLKKDLD